MSRLRNLSLVVLSASALGLTACGSSTGKPSTTPTTSKATTTKTSAATSSAGDSCSSTIAAIPSQDQSPAGTSGTAPTVVVPSGTPPTQLECADLIVGTGVATTAGDAITVQYVLATYSSGKVIQSSWTGQPFQFTLGEGQVIPGWDKGVVGMRVGGRRELIIPPNLGYGAESPGAGIAANDTLVFVVDLLKIS
jgi:peptidylprolyl isomerase